ncbi:hypothetical protein F5051DRAFT_447803 [Lentinula edodes]|nr:hypothetical protein F5051DRAFT_447803 [Lentinula edodes]
MTLTPLLGSLSLGGFSSLGGLGGSRGQGADSHPSSPPSPLCADHVLLLRFPYPPNPWNWSIRNTPYPRSWEPRTLKAWEAALLAALTTALVGVFCVGVVHNVWDALGFHPPHSSSVGEGEGDSLLPPDSPDSLEVIQIHQIPREGIPHPSFHPPSSRPPLTCPLISHPSDLQDAADDEDAEEEDEDINPFHHSPNPSSSS